MFIFATDYRLKTQKHMNKILMMVASVLLIACGSKTNNEDNLTLNSKFDGTLNIYETFKHNDDGSITYNSVP